VLEEAPGVPEATASSVRPIASISVPLVRDPARIFAGDLKVISSSATQSILPSPSAMCTCCLPLVLLHTSVPFSR
jgi:hypothetical protein